MTTGVGSGPALAVTASRSCEFIGTRAGPGRRGWIDTGHVNSKSANSAVSADAIGGRGATDPVPGSARPSVCFERHYEPAELAELWGLSPDKVRRMFEHEPGVILIEGDGARYGKRRHRTLRIPASVAERVHRRLSVVREERFHLTGQKK